MSFGENLEKLVDESRSDLHAAHPTWQRVKLADVALLTNGFAFKSKYFNDEKGFPIVRIRDVVRGVAGTFYGGPIDDPRMTFVENGQIAIGMDGDFNCRIWKGGKSLLNQRVCTLMANEEFYSQKFLAYTLPGYLKLINERTSSVTVKHLSSFTVREIPLPLPPLNEQRRIVEKIETLFARLDQGEAALRQVQTLLVRYRQSVLKAAVTGQLTADWRAENAHRLEPGHDLLERILQTRRETWQGRSNYKEPISPNTTSLPELPDEWVWASVEQLSSSDANALAIGPFGSNLKVEDYRDEGVPLVFVRHIRAKNFYGLNPKFVSGEKAAELSSHKVFPGDILVTKMGDPPGDVCIYPEHAPMAVITADCIRFAVAEDAVCKQFVAHAIASQMVQAQIKKISKGVAQQKVTLANFKRIAVPLPPKEEQELLVERIDQMLSRSHDAEACTDSELTRSTALRQSILKQAFAGRLVPQDPNDEPASELLARIRAAQPVGKGKTLRNASA